MRKLRRFVIPALVMLVAIAPASGTLAAQEQEQTRSVVSRGDLSRAIADKAAHDDQTRQEIRRVLRHEAVRGVAKDLGVDLRDAESAVLTLAGDELASVAAYATELDEALTGGTTITLSLVAALLIVIIIILIAD